MNRAWEGRMTAVPIVRLLILTAAAALLIAAPASAATPFNIGTGTDADVVVDSAGNGHFAWVQGETLHYCRVARGASACNATATPAFPAHSSAASQGPARIVNPSASRIAIIFEVAGGADPGIYEWNSVNNGATFVPAAGTNPRKIGTAHLSPGQYGGRLVDGPNNAANPYVSSAVLSGNDPVFQRMNLAGPASTVEARFDSESPIPAQDVPVGLAGLTPVIAYNSDNNIFFRSYTGATGSATPDTKENVKANWSDPRKTIAGAAGKLPRLATGSSGLRLGWKSTDNKLMTMSWNGSGFSGAVQVSGANGVVDLPNLYAKPGIARYTATWIDSGYGDELDLRYATSTNGTTWGASAPIARGNAANNGFTRQKAAAAADGQGFAVWDGAAGAVTVVPLEAIAEQQAPAGGGNPPSGGNTPPGPTPPAGGGSGLPPGTPVVAPQAPVSHTTVGNEVITFFGPKSCVIPGQKVKLRVTSKRKKKLAGNKGRSKILVATFFLDKTKKKDKKKAFSQSFVTDTFAPGSVHKVGAKLSLKRLSGNKKKYAKSLKGLTTMCT
jgi:hypothetical protein